MFFCSKIYRKEAFSIKALEEKIVNEGRVLPGDILKVNNFINQQIDTVFLKEMGKEIARLFKDSNPTKILTIEASGIAIAVAAAYEMNIPVVFAKKGNPSNVSKDSYSALVESYTRKNVNNITVEKAFLGENDKLLVLDDFLATGESLRGLISIAKQSLAQVVGAVTVIEKGYQGGGDNLRREGLRVESLAIIDEMDENGIKFRPQN